jgi:hypothetical protein
MSLNTCTWCGTDEHVDAYDPVDDIAWCSGPGHPEPRMFQPKLERAIRRETDDKWRYLSNNIAAGYGLYDLLPELLVAGEWSDTNVVEHRFALAHPEIYAELLDRWGHVSQGSRKYSTTSFLGSTLGALCRAANVTHKSGHGSGRFSYNRWVGFWTIETVPADAVDIGWADYAVLNGFDPESWPLA